MGLRLGLGLGLGLGLRVTRSLARARIAAGRPISSTSCRRDMGEIWVRYGGEMGER